LHITAHVSPQPERFNGNDFRYGEALDLPGFNRSSQDAKAVYADQCFAFDSRALSGTEFDPLAWVDHDASRSIVQIEVELFLGGVPQVGDNALQINVPAGAGL
jgi:hypothetical protein